MPELIDWFQTVARRLDLNFLRAYYYDGAYPPSMQAKYAEQRKLFAQIESCPGVHLRLGHLEERRFDYKPSLRAACNEAGISYGDLMKHFKPEKIIQQKGVDTLIVLDMVQLVQQGACQEIILVAGDRDLAEAVRYVQSLGAYVILVHPEGAPVADELRDLADRRIQISKQLVGNMTTHFAERLKSLLEPRPDLSDTD